MGGSQIVKPRKWQELGETEALETYLNANVKNLDNIISNLVIPPAINRKENDTIADSGFTIHFLSDKDPH